MIFSELYSAYYNAVAGIISDIIQGRPEEKNLQNTIAHYAFSESVLTILPSLKSGKWQLVKSDMTTPIKNTPSMPMTLLEKRWLKAISLDPRIRLFDVAFEGLDDIEPLFTQDDYIVYDQYADGDPYSDEGYILRFRTILEAIKTNQALKIEMLNRRGNIVNMKVLPTRLEYSEKDDKFRLISSGSSYGCTVNLARIFNCQIYDGKDLTAFGKRRPKKGTVSLKIYNQRNALERVMLHFAHFEKQAEKTDDKTYIVHITYDKDDETELLIRILGFGPMVEVISPDSFRELIVERLNKQKSCGL